MSRSFRINIPSCSTLILLFLVSAWGCAQEKEHPVGVYVTNSGERFKVETVAENLQVPWSLAFVDGDLYFTERKGQLNVLRKGARQHELVGTIAGVHSAGEGGLMGLTIHPQFSSNAFIYLSHTYLDDHERTRNKVVRYTLAERSLTNPRVIIDGLPGAGVHNGCRIKFGPDKKLYITTGDAAQRVIAQDSTILGGKVLRLNDDGSIPADNPFPGSPIFSLGHRNPQGIDWQPNSKLTFTAEHGPSGFDGPGGGDEVNITESGKNYGWPVVHHQQKAPGMESPLLEFTPAVAPGGMAFGSNNVLPSFNGNLFVATLRGEHLLRIVFKEDNLREVSHTERLLEDVYGRLRDVVQGPDGYIYFCTSNRDGRGSPAAADDRILRITVIE